MTRTPINLRASLAFLHDVCAAALAWSLLYWLRFSLDLPQPYLADLGQTLAWIVPLQAGIFIALGLYRGLWRFASLVDLQRIVLAAALGVAVAGAGGYYAYDRWQSKKALAAATERDLAELPRVTWARRA